MKKLMTGNEAIARGAYEAGVKYASAYPGTPSTEILENIALYKDDILAEWAPNEKVAVEAAAGASIAGARTVASMKHVGLNVAADPLFTVAYTGVTGGFVIITADEPGQHSSQNEQDNRNYARAAKIPMFEPSTSQEAKDMFKEAFEISEKFDTPVLYRLTTRLCHSKGIVECKNRTEVGIKEYVKDAPKYVTVPANSRVLRGKVEERLHNLEKFSNETDLNSIELNDTKVGIIASGMCINFAKEVFGKDASYLKLGFTFPMPDEKIREFASKVEKIYVIEENDEFIEEHVKALGINCNGKDVFPPYGEMTPDVIRKAIYGKTFDHLETNEELLVPRPPTFCAGCPHRGLFYELGKRKDVVITGDIGCYTLGFAPPYNAMDCVVCMGASLGSGHGAQQVFNMVEGNKKRVVGVLGDSTFFHTGINGLLDIIYNNGNAISIILDNRITGMTGHQENPGSGFKLQGEPTNEISIEAVVKACGVKNLRVINPNDLKEVNDTLDWAFANEEASVIITRWPCALKKFSKEDIEEFNKPFTTKCEVVEDLCIGCKKCTKTGCPAISYNKETKKAKIDRNQCLGCDICSQVCPKEAIVKEVK
ncbi:MAG: indolepyruvate ferredoxin oxidoreductase subunit alpha [Terrisporobacter othiniensis]|uniref:indolepyruvate ferredoxin oxidoreductase subunit alpha n=1 Tax=Terrisporobacter petrolearius TaxID=1460447 RepID=UPI0022E7EE14|nr:indolepyruvate ferredoxin oxidoreductase subunit alpha [Terrisporobacter petrolearius]MDU4861448.1 indolepyruvate ferredoxin oxidoreductase subunit alpha [Terrisporobacter othiniensis]MDU6994603.1 indolepyruvate ferredoxin oxidoreductase subunit alpha [Terrisporobacter othiniensis]